MTQFQLFDGVKLKEPVRISESSWSDAQSEEAAAQSEHRARSWRS